jgi:hypothetical protein
MFPATLLRRVLPTLAWRRGHSRIPAVVPVVWRHFGSTLHRVSTTEDLCPGGAFVRTGDPGAVNSPLVLKLATLRGPVEVHARVAWVQRGATGGMGVRFTRTLAGDLT